ncbi:hypothetical protein, partial [Nocardia sp. NPDC059239]|uniref:hypothetical protein n=1 Tax=Nocardia sp. NPDC059239 TaxID=3346785 RepID=UPI0036B9314F
CTVHPVNQTGAASEGDYPRTSPGPTHAVRGSPGEQVFEQQLGADVDPQGSGRLLMSVPVHRPYMRIDLHRSLDMAGSHSPTSDPLFQRTSGNPTSNRPNGRDCIRGTCPYRRGQELGPVNGRAGSK